MTKIRAERFQTGEGEPLIYCDGCGLYTDKGVMLLVDDVAVLWVEFSCQMRIVTKIVTALSHARA